MGGSTYHPSVHSVGMNKLSDLLVAGFVTDSFPVQYDNCSSKNGIIGEIGLSEHRFPDSCIALHIMISINQRTYTKHNVTYHTLV